MKLKRAISVSFALLALGACGSEPEDSADKAQPQPADTPSISEVGDLDLFGDARCPDDSLRPGSKLKVTGFNFLPSKQVTLSWQVADDLNQTGPLGTAVSDKQGHLESIVEFPVSLEDATIEVIAIGPSPAGTQRSGAFLAVGSC